MSTDQIDERIRALFQARSAWCSETLTRYSIEVQTQTLSVEKEGEALYAKMRATARQGEEPPGDDWEWLELHDWSGWVPSDLMRQSERLIRPPFPPDPRSRRLTLNEKTFLLALRLDARLPSASPLAPVEERLVELEPTAAWVFGSFGRSPDVGLSRTGAENRTVSIAAMRLSLAQHKPHDLPDDLTADAWLDVLERMVPPESAEHSPDDPLKVGGEPIAVSPSSETTADERERKTKRSTVRGEGRDKLIAALTKYHDYSNGGCGITAPIGSNELARLATVAPSTASTFFNAEFRGHVQYRRVCADASQLVAALKLLNQEFSPHLLYGDKPTGEGERYGD